MKSYSRCLQIINLFLLSLTLGTVFAADPPALTGSPSTVVTSEILEVKIAEVEAATDLPETTKTKLTELYRETLDQRFPATRYPPRYQQIPQGTGGAGSGACYGWWNRAASGLTEVIITPLPHNKAVNAISVKSTG